jgi:fermentation-respiration switch protein FrsA (DUF1100 family)
MLRRCTAAAFIATVLLLVAACADEPQDTAIASDVQGEPSEQPGAQPRTIAPPSTTDGAADPYTFEGDFYSVPDPLPAGEPGDLIRAERIPSTDPAVDTLWRVLYHSESVAGDDIAVSGVVAVSSAPAPAGGRPIVSWAHGTTGIADVCAPSKDPNDVVAPAFADPFLDDGYILVATDYEGLGTPGRHPYIVGESEGRGAIDIVRAARHLPDTDAGNRFAVWGHSQGGHAALFANQIAASWAPELELVGSVAGAPATELPLLAVALQNSPFRYYLAMTAAGWNAAYADAALDLVLTDQAIDVLDAVDEGCADTIAAAFQGFTYEQLAKADPATVEPWKTLIVENDPGHVVSPSPLFVYHGGNDEQIPVAASKLLFDRLCGLGQVVTRTVYDGQSHAGVVSVAYPDIKQWIDDRFAGVPAPDDCPPPT